MTTNNINQAHWNEWVNGSAVDPDIVSLNVRSLSGTTPHEYLLYSDKLDRRNNGRLSTRYLRRYQHLEDGGWWCSGVDLLAGNDSLWGCFKPNTPRITTDYNDQGHFKKQKTVKYEHPPKAETEVFFLKVPLTIWQEIATRYEVPLPEQITITQAGEALGFWQWVMENPKVALTITEGAKKAGALLSGGYCAIALPGIFNGYRQAKDETGSKIGQPHLIPQLQILATQGREFYFAYDSDSKVSTIANVNKAIEKTAKLLEKEGCTCKVIGWSNEYKGVDDFIVAKGIEAFTKAYAQAKPIALWQVTQLKQLTYRVSLEIEPSLRYLPELNIPPTAKLIGLKARKGRGKTHQIAALVAEASHQGRRTLILSHRRQLVQELCDRCCIDNVVEYRTSDSGGVFGYGLCVDSLHRQSNARFNPDDWQDALIIIDEVEQVLWHLLSANTEVKKNRVRILKNFRQLLQNVLTAEKGQVLVADADLSDLALDYLRSLVDNPPDPFIIHQPVAPSTITPEERWDIINYPDTNCKRLILDLIEHIRDGGKPMVCLSAQQMKSQYGTINLEATLRKHFPKLKILRIDSESIANPKHPAYGCISHLNEILVDYDVVLASPSIETGVSIDIRGHFTSVWGIAGGTSSDNAVCQSLARVRENVPRYLWISKVGHNRVGNGTTNPKELFVRQKRETNSHIKLLLESEEYEIHGIDCQFQAPSLWCWARMAVRVNLGMIAYRQSILDYLRNEGHRIRNVDELFDDDEQVPKETDNNVSDDGDDHQENATIDAHKVEQIKQLGEQLKQVSEENCQTYYRCVSESLVYTHREEEEVSRRLSRTDEERARLHKTRLCRQYHVDEVSPQLVELDSQGVYKGMQLHYYLSVGRTYLKHNERDRLEKLLKQGQGALFSPDFNRGSLSAKIWLYEYLQ
ncbi:MAG: plasmid replication protein, CyRepA1 family, partial [Cyanobacteria bacterium P01_G01_bin.49]